MSSGQRFHFQDGAGRAFALPAAPTHDNGVHVHVHYHDQGAMQPESYDNETCGNEGEDCQASRDAGRIRFATRPQSNHMPGGGFADERMRDPRQAANLRPNARPPEYRGRVAEPPNYTGRYGELPSANSNRNAGNLVPASSQVRAAIALTLALVVRRWHRENMIRGRTFRPFSRTV